MSDPAVTQREGNAPADHAMSGNVPVGRDVSLEIRLTAGENQILAQRAEAVGQTLTGYILDQAVADPIPAPPGRSSEIAILEAQVEELRSKGAKLATHNAELEQRLG